MRLVLDPRARRLLRRVPRSTFYSAAELLLFSLLAIQCARLLWTLVTPLGPVGDWRTESAIGTVPPGASALLGEFDPFFRLSGDGGPIVVTSLDLKLFGVRENRATGRGSAIIATPDGLQRSFAVGEEIVPGVTLTAVNFDSATISRGGTAEQMFLDQSPPATVVDSEGVIASMATTPAAPTSAGPATANPAPGIVPTSAPGSIMFDVAFQPRMDEGQVTGVTVQPRGSGDAFRAAGFAPGDVIRSVNGQPIRSAAQARELAGQLDGQETVTVEVERDGRTISLSVRPNP